MTRHLPPTPGEARSIESSAADGRPRQEAMASSASSEHDDSSRLGPLPAPVLVPGGLEWRLGEYVVSTDPDRLDIPLVSRILAGTYWAAEIPERVVRRSIEHSIAFGLYRGTEQVGFARAVTDRATFAWLSDVFVVEEHRGRGAGLLLIRCVVGHPELRDLRRWMLGTRDAHGLYERIGFRPVGRPERLMEILDPEVHRRQAAADRAANSGLKQTARPTRAEES